MTINKFALVKPHYYIILKCTAKNSCKNINTFISTDVLDELN